jgi:hypothetical protein
MGGVTPALAQSCRCATRRVRVSNVFSPRKASDLNSGAHEAQLKVGLAGAGHVCHTGKNANVTG